MAVVGVFKIGMLVLLSWMTWVIEYIFILYSK
jgi:hypothetical protein